jgi:hypothetical protein
VDGWCFSSSPATARIAQELNGACGPAVTMQAETAYLDICDFTLTIRFLAFKEMDAVQHQKLSEGTRFLSNKERSTVHDHLS